MESSGPAVTTFNDIATREDIRTLVDGFYAKALKDPVIGFLFTEVAQIDLPTHLPKLYRFWEMVLLGGQAYQGSPLIPHFHLHMRHPLEWAHFVRWLELFHETVDEHFAGPVADLAKARAERIAANFHARIQEGQEAGLFVSKGYSRANPTGVPPVDKTS
jgi:truncated hemoglobin YjbI